MARALKAEPSSGKARDTGVKSNAKGASKAEVTAASAARDACAALGLSRDEYYAILCGLADQLCGRAEELEPAHAQEPTHAHAGGSCGCRRGGTG
mgnify:CR=1 FL=1